MMKLPYIITVLFVGLAVYITPLDATNLKLKSVQHDGLREPGVRQCNATGPDCWDECGEIPDGVYQWCGSCSTFLQCQNQQMYYGECMAGYTWDDKKKKCVVSSATCSECYEPPMCVATGSQCIDTCDGLPDGYYQLCSNCTSYVQCTHNISIIHDCFPGLVYDQGLTACVPESDTCTECMWYWCNNTGLSCINDCIGKPYGSYQSCVSCHEFIECNQQVVTRYKCPPGLVWADALKACASVSASCRECEPPELCECTGVGCIRNCADVGEGFHQLCANCTSYGHCGPAGFLTVYHCNPPNIYDGDVHACMPFSNTCQECSPCV